MDTRTAYDIGIKSLKRALDYYEVDYEQEGIQVNMSQWNSGKRDLIEKLSTHPHWNDQAMAIIMPIEVSTGGGGQTFSPEVALIQLYQRMGEESGEDNPLVEMFMDITPFLQSQTLRDTDVENIKNISPGILANPVVGMKTSRYVRKLCVEYGIMIDDNPVLRNIYARLSDALNPTVETRELVFSINPADYVLMSQGNSWTTCQSIEPGGGRNRSYGAAYRAGCLSYMNDCTTVVSYILMSTPDKMEDMSLMRKVSRQLFHIRGDGKLLIQAIGYPNLNKETRRNIRRVVHGILSEVYGFENKWGPPKRGSKGVDNQMDYNHYPDYSVNDHGITCSFAVTEKENYADGSMVESIEIGGDVACLICGEYDIEDTSTVYCSNCADDVNSSDRD